MTKASDEGGAGRFSKAIATACPYCAIMLRDGVAQLGRDDLPTKDIAEIVAESLGDN